MPVDLPGDLAVLVPGQGRHVLDRLARIGQQADRGVPGLPRLPVPAKASGLGQVLEVGVYELAGDRPPGWRAEHRAEAAVVLAEPQPVGGLLPLQRLQRGLGALRHDHRAALMLLVSGGAMESQIGLGNIANVSGDSVTLGGLAIGVSN
jgi:hypothetical protein